MLAGDELRDAVRLVFASKQDLPKAMKVAESMDKLGLHSLCHRNRYIRATCATSRDRLYEGLDWLSNQLQNQKAAPPPPPHVLSLPQPAGVRFANETTTLTFFSLILINTEEAGAFQLYLGEILRTGLFGVVEPLTAFNTRLVINCFVYLFPVFISTSTVIIATKVS
uniref:Uncharacterized protein n=1 Tax=Panthera leo TaxID=9689 RepID=A0A8C8W992_PANLE